MNGTIYEASGKAREYSELACNLYEGCAHGCLYCYNRSMAGKWARPDFDNPRPKEGILEKLERSARAQQKKGDIRPVFFCFTTDPYQPIDKQYGLTRQAIEIIHKYDIPVMLLTKGGKRAERDFDLLRAGDMFGATLTFTDDHDSDSVYWEPGAALPFNRIQTLYSAHELGIKTWVSLEPVIDTRQSLELIRQTNGFVDHFKVGKWNHDKESNNINWRIFAYEARATLKRHRCDYYIKKDLAKYL